MQGKGGSGREAVTSQGK